MTKGVAAKLHEAFHAGVRVRVERVLPIIEKATRREIGFAISGSSAGRSLALARAPIRSTLKFFTNFACSIAAAAVLQKAEPAQQTINFLANRSIGLEF